MVDHVQGSVQAEEHCTTNNSSCLVVGPKAKPHGMKIKLTIVPRDKKLPANVLSHFSYFPIYLNWI